MYLHVQPVNSLTISFIWDKDFHKISPVLAYLISHALIHLLGKVKIENFHMFYIPWLYRTSRYTIIKVDVIESNDITERHRICHHNMADVRNRSDCIIKTPTFRNESYTRKRICNECDRQIEKSIPWNHSLTSLGKPRDARQ